jgi:hypothetical protein
MTLPPVSRNTQIDRHHRTAAGLASAVLFVAAITLQGCGPGLPPYTANLITGQTVDGLRQFQFFVSADVELISQRKGKLVGEPPFQKEEKTRYIVSRETPGTIVAAEATWMVVDFGQGILLTFRLADNRTFVMPSWGSVTLNGERFDVNMGVLAGTHIVLHYRPAPPPGP